MIENGDVMEKSKIRPKLAGITLYFGLFYAGVIEIVFPLLNEIFSFNLPTVASSVILSIFVVPVMGWITSRGIEKMKGVEK